MKGLGLRRGQPVSKSSSGLESELFPDALCSTVSLSVGRTIHTYHTEGAGGGHAPDIIKATLVPKMDAAITAISLSARVSFFVLKHPNSKV